MANIYVRSTDGSDADTGLLLWTLAKATLTGAAAIDASGDNIYVSQVHAESTAAAVSISLAGTAALPVNVICANDAAAPPTASATTATVSTSGNFGITFAGTAFYVHGLGVNCAVGGTTVASIVLNNTGSSRVTYSRCLFTLSSSATACRLDVILASGQITTLENCNVSFAAATHGLRIGAAGAFIWNGGAIAAGSAAITALFANGGTNGSSATVSGIDLSAGAATMNLFTVGAGATFGVIRNCKLPAAWTGALTTGTISVGERYEMYNCDSGDTNYRLWIADYTGSVKSETIIVRTGGASDGVTPLSWVMVSSANAEYPLLALASPEIVRWNDTVAAAITVTVEVVTDNVTLTDAECWLEVQYLGTSGVPLGTFISDAKADVLGAAANQTTSTVAWTTTGLATPVKQRLAATFTPQEKGFLHAVVRLTRASTTVYVDPLLTVT